ncbi:MAG TPA: SRPBCC family protein [Steroidobacteraceae bacterium]|jgi:uncharacterized protein YndB with AHSA1/START domain
MTNSSTKDREIVLERTFDAPRDVVFDAFTNPKHVDHWWGPNGYSTTTSKMDVRDGGEWIYLMKHAQFGEFKNRIRYHRVTRPARLQYLHDSGVDNDPAAFEVEITFEEERGKTKVTMRSLFPSVAEVERVKGFGAVRGGEQTLARLSEYLKK